MILLITVFCSVRLRDSRLGRAWIAIREDETAAAAMGIPLMRTKTWAYALGAFFGGVAGAFYASFKAGAFPADFYFNISVFLLCMVILGGMGSVWGVLLGGMILGYLNVEGLATIGSKIQQSGIPSRELRPDQVPVRDLRDHHRPDDALPADRVDPRTPAQDRDEEGVHDTPFYDVQHEGTLTDRDRRMTDNLIEVDQAAEGVRRPRGHERHRLHDPSRLDRLADRPERCRQDDVLQPAHRRLQAHLRHDRLRRRRRHRQAAARDHRSSASAVRSRTSGSSSR